MTSAYRNPERNEAVGGAPASRHMLGRALDVAFLNVASLGTKTNPTPSFDRGLVYYKAWEVIHGSNPTTPKSNSATVPWADFWQLEDIKSKAILKSNAGRWVNPLDSQDISQTGIPDGFERTGHLHMQDDPNVGVHP